MTSEANETPVVAAAEPATQSTAPEIDMSSIVARWEAQRAEAAERRKAERAALLSILRDQGVEEIEAGYDGYADSGNVGEITVSPAGVAIPELEARLGDFIWGVAYHLHPGFENDDGGEGTLAWDVTKDRIDVEHADFYTGRNEFTHEDV